MEQFMNGIYDVVNSISPYVYLIVAAALICVGVMFIIPSQRIHEMAKQSVLWVLIGCGLACLATVLAKQITGAFGF